MRRVAVFGILVVTSVLLLAACGGGGGSRLSASDYRNQLDTIGKEADADQATAVKEAEAAKTIADLQTTLAHFSAAEQKLSDEVAKLKPPKNADASNTELAGGLHDLSNALKSMAPKAAKAASIQAGLALIGKDPQVLSSGKQVDHALAALKKLGYSKGS